MIKISRNDPKSRAFLLLFNCLPTIIVIVYLIFGSSDFKDVILCLAVSILNGYIAYRISFCDYDLLLDKKREIVKLKKGNINHEYALEEFMTFKLEFINTYMSGLYKFYNLRLVSQTYRIRFYIDKVDNNVSIINPQNETALLESELKRRIVRLSKSNSHQ